MIPSASPAGCYLMQLTMKKFDVKKNYLTTKDLVGVDYKNFNFILRERCGFKKWQFYEKTIYQFVIIIIIKQF